MVVRFAQVHEAQLLNHPVTSEIPVGLLLNFGEEKVEVKRKVRVLNPSGESRYPVQVWATVDIPACEDVTLARVLTYTLPT